MMEMPPWPGARSFLVTLAQNEQQYLFWAEDEQHAREQAENAEPDNPVVRVEEAV